MKKVKICLIIVWLLFHTVILCTLQHKKILSFQNRESYEFPKFQFHSFVSSSYQNNLDKAINDRIYKSDQIKQQKAKIDSILYKHMSIAIPKDSYHLAVGSQFFYQNSDYLIDWPRSDKWLKMNQDQIKDIANSYNQITGIKKYLYYINTSDSIHFKTKKNRLDENIKKHYNTFTIDSFKINNYSEYKKYFYKSDYHWNHVGSYQGYQDIIYMMKGKNEKILIPDIELKISDNFYGNRSKYNQYFYVKDSFSKYQFDFKKRQESTTPVVPIKKNVNLKEDPKSHVDYYSLEYESIGKELIYDFQDPQKENLLILSNSFGLPILELIASHYNKTYVIDLRENPDFRIKEYLKEKRIDTMLVITSGVYYADNRFKLKGV